jgi:hypothetical protein
MEELLCHMTISSMAIRLTSVERVIVIAVPFVATLIFSPDTKPSAASHFPFSRMLGTMHSFLRFPIQTGNSKRPRCRFCRYHADHARKASFLTL